jgi:hypothetical protein
MSLDKLFIASESPLRKEALEIISNQQQLPHNDKHYANVYCLKFGESRVMVKTNPRFAFGNASETRLELNPWHFPSWDHTLNAIAKLIDPETAFVKRIDHAVDKLIPLSLVHQCVRVKFKQDSTVYWESHKRSIMTGIYFGNKPEIHCYYDKGYELLGPKKSKRVPGIDVGVITRFEVRQFKDRIKYPRLLDIQKYLNINPFENIQFLEADPGTERKKADALQTLLEEKGLRKLHSELNIHNNAMRVLKDLKERDISSELANVYREELRQWLKNESKVVKSRLHQPYKT